MTDADGIWQATVQMSIPTEVSTKTGWGPLVRHHGILSHNKFCKINHKNNAATGCTIPKAFLTSSIPKLQLNSQARLYFDKSGKEINSNSWLTSLVKLALREVLQQGRLSYSTVSEQYHSKLVVENRLHHTFLVHKAYYKYKNKELVISKAITNSPQAEWCKPAKIHNQNRQKLNCSQLTSLSDDWAAIRESGLIRLVLDVSSESHLISHKLESDHSSYDIFIDFVCQDATQWQSTTIGHCLYHLLH